MRKLDAHEELVLQTVAKMVMVELAVAVVLLAGAGLLGQSFYRLLHVRLGFDPSHLATVRVMAPDTAYKDDEQIVGLQREIVRRVSSLPGVESAALAYEPHRIAFYLMELAAAFHGVWNKGNDNASLRFIVADDRNLTRARCALIKSVQIVLQCGLAVMGCAPLEELRNDQVAA